MGTKDLLPEWWPCLCNGGEQLCPECGCGMHGDVPCGLCAIPPYEYPKWNLVLSARIDRIVGVVVGEETIVTGSSRYFVYAKFESETCYRVDQRGYPYYTAALARLRCRELLGRRVDILLDGWFGFSISYSSIRGKIYELHEGRALKELGL